MHSDDVPENPDEHEWTPEPSIEEPELPLEEPEPKPVVDAPAIADLITAQQRGLANVATWQLACRLADLGAFRGVPADRGVQGYPRKAVAAWQVTHGHPGTGRYDDATHASIWAP